MHLYRYAHLSRIIINQGDSVTPGQLIGLVGSTGKSTGPHLHFEVHVLPNGGTIDPLLVLVAG
jgi:murein DD-endopeptidase MepM/ murein hydrolase activator NlpD